MQGRPRPRNAWYCCRSVTHGFADTGIPGPAWAGTAQQGARPEGSGPVSGVRCSRPSGRIDQVGKECSLRAVQRCRSSKLVNCADASTTTKNCASNIGCRSPRLSPWDAHAFGSNRAEINDLIEVASPVVSGNTRTGLGQLASCAAASGADHALRGPVGRGLLTAQPCRAALVRRGRRVALDG